jgi:hypothetical protein
VLGYTSALHPHVVIMIAGPLVSMHVIMTGATEREVMDLQKSSGFLVSDGLHSLASPGLE